MWRREAAVIYKWSQKPVHMLGDEEKMYEAIAEFISQHYAQPLTLEQLSQLCGVSQSTFVRKFKQYNGKAFTMFRNEQRIKVAMALLAETDQKIISISHEVGFGDVSFFNQIFRRFTGSSPAKYRALHKHGWRSVRG